VRPSAFAAALHSIIMAIARTLLAELCGWPPRRLMLDFVEELRPAGGSCVVLPSAAPISISSKEPVGNAFHTKVLQQAGLYGERYSLLLSLGARRGVESCVLAVSHYFRMFLR
jgi:hypothetical protein